MAEPNQQSPHVPGVPAKRPDNRIPTTSVTNELRDYIDRHHPAPHMHNSGTTPPLGEAWAFIGRTIDSGPASEPDFSDNRYWVIPVFIRPDPDGALIRFQDDQDSHELTRYVVENVAEKPPSGQGDAGTHALAVGSWVYVYAQYDTEGDDAKLRYFTFTGGLLPRGQYQEMFLKMVTQLIPGYDFARLTAPL